MKSGRDIATVLDRASCKKHRADIGEPCWTVYFGASPGIGQAICNARVKRAGYTGQPTTMSSRPNSATSRRPGRPRTA